MTGLKPGKLLLRCQHLKSHSYQDNPDFCWLFTDSWRSFSHSCISILAPESQGLEYIPACIGVEAKYTDCLDSSLHHHIQRIRINIQNITCVKVNASNVQYRFPQHIFHLEYEIKWSFLCLKSLFKFSSSKTSFFPLCWQDFLRSRDSRQPTFSHCWSQH